MKFSPWIIGAALAVPVAGGVVGSNINTEPLDAAQDISNLLPEKRSVASVSGTLQRQRLPNHYELETPAGVVDIEDLAFRGRDPEAYRRAEAMEAAYAAEMAAYEAELESGFASENAADYAYTQQPSTRRAVRSIETFPTDAAPAASELITEQAPAPAKPIQYAENAAGTVAAPVQAEVSTIVSGARVVNVTAALAE